MDILHSFHGRVSHEVQLPCHASVSSTFSDTPRYSECVVCGAIHPLDSPDCLSQSRTNISHSVLVAMHSILLHECLVQSVLWKLSEHQRHAHGTWYEAGKSASAAADSCLGCLAPAR